MKILLASKHLPGQKQELIDVNNLFDLPNRTDKDYMDYLAVISEDMDKRGMEHPILVIKKDNYWGTFPWQDDNKMGVVTGSNRFRYALDKGYTHIESIIVNGRNDWFPLWRETFYRIRPGKSDLTISE
tara:strand:- start:284 stop:667 length:384 start_codon:yes stop_codon:yes gene_type:complete